MTDRNDELGSVLRSLLLEEADTMKTDTLAASQRLRRELTSSKKRRSFTLVATGIAAAIVLGLILWNQSSDPASTRLAGQPEDTGATAGEAPYLLDLSSGAQTPLPEELVPASDAGLRPTYAPDATAVALECAPATCLGLPALEIVSEGGGRTEVPVPADSFVSVLGWSGDGTKLVYRQMAGSFELGNLFVYDLGQGVSTQITDLGLGNVYWVDVRADFSPDGETVVFHSPRNGLAASPLDVWTVPVTGGEPRLVIRNAAQPEFLPDGSGIAFVRPGSTSLMGRVVEVIADGRPPEPLFKSPEEIVVYQLAPDGTRVITSGEGHKMIDLRTGEVSDLPNGGDWAGNDTLLVSPEN